MSNTSVKRSKASFKDENSWPQPVAPPNTRRIDPPTHIRERLHPAANRPEHSEDSSRFSISSVDDSLRYIGLGARSDVSSIHSEGPIIDAPYTIPRAVPVSNDAGPPSYQVQDTVLESPNAKIDLDAALATALQTLVPVSEFTRSTIPLTPSPDFTVPATSLRRLEKQMSAFSTLSVQIRKHREAEEEEKRAQLRKYEDLNAAFESLKEGGRTRTQAIEALSKRNEVLQEENSELRNEVEQIKKFAKARRGQLKVKNDKIKKIVEDIEFLQDENASLRSTLAGNDKTIAKYETQIITQEMVISQLKTKPLERLKDTTKARKLDTEELQDTILEKNERICDLKIELEEKLQWCLKLGLARELAEARLEIKELEDGLRQGSMQQLDDAEPKIRFYERKDRFWVLLMLLGSAVAFDFGLSLFSAFQVGSPDIVI